MTFGKKTWQNADLDKELSQAEWLTSSRCWYSMWKTGKTHCLWKQLFNSFWICFDSAWSLCLLFAGCCCWLQSGSYHVMILKYDLPLFITGQLFTGTTNKTISKLSSVTFLTFSPEITHKITHLSSTLNDYFLHNIHQSNCIRGLRKALSLTKYLH